MILKSNVMADVMYAEEVWELSQRNYILTQAQKYAATFPKLEWIFCRQRPMKITCPGDRSFGNAVPLSEDRDTRRTLLSRMFGFGGEDE